MRTTSTWTDRLRIERALWTIDTRVQSLPGRSRRAIRRELRTNLRASAADVGAVEAIHRLGNLHQLADGYLDAEYTDRRRPQLRKAVFWTVTVASVILWSAFVGHSAFVNGAEAANPRPDGRFVWDGMKLLGVGGDVSYADGQLRSFGLSFNLWILLLLVAAFLIGGRLWRLAPRRRRRRDPHPDPVTSTRP